MPVAMTQMRGKRFTKEQQRSIADRYEAGATLCQLGNDLNVSQDKIRYVIVRLGGTIRPRALRPRAADESAIRAKYLSGESASRVGQAFGFSKNGMLKRLRKLGVVRTRGRKLKPGEPRKICDLYIDGWRTSRLAKRFHVTPSHVLRILRKADVPCRDYGGERRRYKVREDAFETIDEQSAYFAGLLMADGCVKTPLGYPGVVSLTLQTRDVAIINALRKFLGSYHPIRTYRQFTNLTIVSKRLAGSLAALGIGPRKSFSAKAADRFALNRHFWRGMIDGDGSVAMTVWSPQVSIVGSLQTMQQFVGFVRTINPDTTAKVLPSKMIHRVGLNADDSYAVLKLLYTNCKVAIPRKWGMATFILNNYTPAHQPRVR